MEEPLFKIGDLLMEERYPQGGTFIVVDVVGHVSIAEGWRYKLAFEWGHHWVLNKFASRCIKIG